MEQPATPITQVGSTFLRTATHSMHPIRRRRRSRCTAPIVRCLLAVGLLVLLIATREASAQQVTFRHYGQQDGLANLSVGCLLQDHEGFIWMCTENGLFRHDGTDFERFGEDEGIAVAVIHSAVEDSAGRLWVGTANDLYLGEGGRFRAIRPEGHSLNIDPGLRLAVLAPDWVLVIEKNQLWELRVSGTTWSRRPFFSPERLRATPALQQLNSIAVDHVGRIWLGCGTGICGIRRGQISYWNEQSGVPQDLWRAWLLDAQGQLWVRGLNHVVVLEEGARQFQTRDPPHARLTADILNVPLVADRQGRILTRSDAGLVRWEHGAWREFTPANGITAPTIDALLISSDGAVWMGVSGRGLFRWQGYEEFESWKVSRGPDANSVWSVIRSPDRGILMGTRTGCYRIDETTHNAVSCQIDGLPAGEIQLVAERADHSLWMAMTTGELLRVARGEHRAKLIADLPLMRRLYVDSADRLWISSNTGIFVTQPGQTRVEALRLPIVPGEITDIVEDPRGPMWFASQGGLLRWSRGRWAVFTVSDPHARAGFASVTVADDGWLWAGTNSQGIMRLHVSGERIDRSEWVPEPAVARSTTYFARRDGRNWIWVGTDSGVDIYDGQLWRKFSQPDGLIWNDTNQNSVFIDDDGSVWIGTSGGLSHILDPERLMRRAPLDLRITRAKFGETLLENPLSQRVSWNPDAALDLHLATLEGAQAQRSFFRTRLRGLSDEWFETRDPQFHYPGLGPGEYRFEAVAVDPDHQRTSQLVALRFELLPPWWGTLWFRLLAVTAACGLLAAVWSYRMESLKAHKRELERQLQEREALLQRATRDALTGLWNRTAILEILVREIEAARNSSTSLAIVLIDVDHFKRINDTYGHLCGDAVLRMLTSQLSARVRVSDSLGRFGGEEFLLVLPGAPPRRPFLPLERLRRAIAEIPFTHEGMLLNVTASFGMAWLQDHTDTVEKLLGRADTALYSAKGSGRNRVEYAEAG